MQPYSTHSLPALRDWLGKLSSDAPTVEGESDERASGAPVDEEAVEKARQVAEWETFEVDQVLFTLCFACPSRALLYSYTILSGLHASK